MYDIIILGSGPGGYVAAIKAAQQHLKVALVEKNEIGGVCLNWGCIPTKSLLKSAKVYQHFLHAKDYGIVVAKENIGFDWQEIIKRKNRIVKRLTGGVSMLLKKHGVDVFKGEGTVINANTVRVNDSDLEGKNILLATGASPVIPPIDSLQESYQSGFVKTSKELLDIASVPEKLVIIGGGVIGLEFATIFNAFGSQVTIIEREENILLNVDEEIRVNILKLIKRAKIKVLTSSAVTKVKDGTVYYKTSDNAENSITADQVLLSVGMKANTDHFKDLNLENEGRFIKVDQQFQTSVKGVYAIGDVNGKMMLAHVASHQGIIAVEHILGHNNVMNFNQIPSAIYAFPEIAQIGLTEKEAKDQNIDFVTSKFPIQANGKSMASNERDGFIKIIASKPYNEIIGVHILAENASDLISEALMTMTLEGTAEELAKAVHPHPTVSEIFNEAALGIIDKPIHI